MEYLSPQTQYVHFYVILDQDRLRKGSQLITPDYKLN